MKQLDYSIIAQYYDILDLDGGIDLKFNLTLDKLFKKYNIKEILDFSCGTGAQTKYFYDKGYKIIGSDISHEMIEVAKSKNTDIKYFHGDMRYTNLGKFPCVISIYNAIGHLNKPDFEIALKNISSNLEDGGFFIFDIFNYNCAIRNLHDKWFIGVKKEVDGIKFERLNQNILNENTRKIKFNQKNTIQKGSDRPKIIKHSWELQIYDSNEITNILNNNGFKIVELLDVNGSKFNDKESYSILTVAQRI